MRNITCSLFPWDEFVAELVPFFTKALPFKRWRRGSPMTCFNVFLSQAVGLFYLRYTSVSNLLYTQLTVIHF